ncbi:hypothetical protein Htur_3070 [Haloterrigena turkmenica DSM 5511]|uniref:Uncharacterized protein n=1 Tax=Haloterrigena turkmenica (strain ATCC 51198 / DSM 5511 / JCM 9101 / NCIMB 13204 / VKM B-1734 / 4k) TaxID=543526 RepID=D2RYW7_HALTV|nr:hypothetical protein [Haloterrigena turkmenica]ADB61935.1 hypothetical protein Htur_3070 [Haloterrigena turkmenica DSM 5511]
MATEETASDSETESAPDTADSESEPAPDPADTERSAVHEVELALEWFQRAQGQLLAFHHATGHGMDHLREAERLLREAGRDDLADDVRDELLPHGVVDDDRWSYDVVENYQRTLLAEARRLEGRVRRELTDGRRHVTERLQERAWKERADDT